VITLTPETYSYLQTDGGYVTITYTCQLTDLSDIKNATAGTTVDLGSYNNRVVVTTSDSSTYGSDDQTQELTYEKEDTTVYLDTVNKSYSWSNENDTLSYSILLNPDAETLNGGSALEFTDVLIARTWGTGGNYASLVQSSVKFYKLTKVTLNSDNQYVDEDGNVYSGSFYIAEDGTVYYMETLSVSWQYEEVEETYSTTHTITASLPDSTAILVEYTYRITLYEEGDTPDHINGLSNTATLSGTSSYTDSNDVQESYSEPDFAAGVSAHETFTLEKVDSENTGKVLENAIYALYKYDPDNSNADDDGWVFINCFTTNSSGAFSITPTDLGDDFSYNTAYYVVETEAPEGYILDSSTKYYFYWSNSDTDTYTESYPSDWSGHDLTVASYTIYAKNTQVPTISVNVEKVWEDENGDSVNKKSGSVDVDLYRYVGATGTSGSDNVTVTVYFEYPGYSTLLTEEVPAGTEITVDIGVTSGTISNVYAYETDASWNSVSSTTTGTNSTSTITTLVVSTDTTVEFYGTSDSSATGATASIDYEGKSTGGDEPSTEFPADGEYVGTYSISADNNWTLEVTDLPQYYVDENGNINYYYYYFVEKSVTGYTTSYSSYDGVTDGGTITITNKGTDTEESGSLTVTKAFDDDSDLDMSSLTDDQKAQITIKITNASDETDVLDSFTLAEKTTGTYSVPLDTEYVVTETSTIEGYTWTKTYTITATANESGVTSDASAGTVEFTEDGAAATVTVTNKYVEYKGSLKIMKKTEGEVSTPDDTLFTITGPNGYCLEVKYSEFEDNGTYTVENLPLGSYEVKEDKDSAAAIGYTLDVDESGNTATVEKDETATVTITNEYTPVQINISIKKDWDDADDQDGIRPETITVVLIKNGEVTDKTLTLSADNNWTGSFTGLDEYTDGKLNEYTVQEVSVEGYTSVITGDAETGYVITNTHEAETIEISGTKTWDDKDDQDSKRPKSITIRLLADGEEVDNVEVTAEDNWTYTFTDLPKYADGEEIVYTITEDAVSSYSTTYDGYNITNSYMPGQTSITVTKAWDDSNDQDGIRPETITVVLVKNGEATDQTLTLSADNN